MYTYHWKTFNYITKELWDLSGFDSETKFYALCHLRIKQFGNQQARHTGTDSD